VIRFAPRNAAERKSASGIIGEALRRSTTTKAASNAAPAARVATMRGCAKPSADDSMRP
jgi:hypothetical protein